MGLQLSERIPSYYWDTCVFTAYLNDERSQHGKIIDHIRQFIEEAEAGKCKLYCSTVSIAEITSSTLGGVGFSSFDEFLSDLRGAVTPIDPSPIIMGVASHLRSQRYEKSPNGNRILSTPDAIHLASAISLRDIFGVQIDAFHTFDKGKRRGEDGGKGLPLIGYETWCERCKDDETVQKVVALRRENPKHPSPRLDV